MLESPLVAIVHVNVLQNKTKNELQKFYFNNNWRQSQTFVSYYINILLINTNEMAKQYDMNVQCAFVYRYYLQKINNFFSIGNINAYISKLLESEN